jgi:uncharacterized membrane protein HdeD (DUF308 family)
MDVIFARGVRHWWFFLIRGILFIALGIYMVATPAASYAALAFLFGLIIFIAGIVELIRVVRDNDSFNRGLHLILGVIDIILGIVLMSHIAAGETILRILVGLWFLFRGLSLFGFSSVMRRSWPVIVGGVLIIIFSLFILFNSVFGAVTIILWTAFAFVITGLMNIVLAMRLKPLEH